MSLVQFELAKNSNDITILVGGMGKYQRCFSKSMASVSVANWLPGGQRDRSSQPKPIWDGSRWRWFTSTTSWLLVVWDRLKSVSSGLSSALGPTWMLNVFHTRHAYVASELSWGVFWSLVASLSLLKLVSQIVKPSWHCLVFQFVGTSDVWLKDGCTNTFFHRAPVCHLGHLILRWLWSFHLKREGQFAEWKQPRSGPWAGWESGKWKVLLFSALIGLASYTFQLPSICVLRTALKKFCSNNGGLLAGTSWHLLLEGSFASVLQCFPLPTYTDITDAVFNSNSFSKRAMQNLNWEKCVSRAVPNWDKVMMFFFLQRFMLAYYHWSVVIYLCYIIRRIVTIVVRNKNIIITPLPTYLPPYLIHMKARPRLQTSGGSSCLILIQSCRRLSEVKHCTGPKNVDPAGCIWTWKLKI